MEITGWFLLKHIDATILELIDLTKAGFKPIMQTFAVNLDASLFLSSFPFH